MGVDNPLACVTPVKFVETEIEKDRREDGRDERTEYGGGGVSVVAVEVLPKLLGTENVDEASEESSPVGRVRAWLTSKSNGVFSSTGYSKLRRLLLEELRCSNAGGFSSLTSIERGVYLGSGG